MDRTKSFGKSVPAGENSTYLQIGRSEEDKLEEAIQREAMRRDQYAMDDMGNDPALLGAAGLAGVAGLGALGLTASQRAEEANNESLPAYLQPKTVEEHALHYGKNFVGSDPGDYMQYEGVRQGLLGGVIQPIDVDRMAVEGRFSPRAMQLIEDIHNFGASGLSPNPREIAELIERDGGDGRGYLMQQQRMRDELGIDIPL